MLLDTRSSEYFALNAVGACFWQCLSDDPGFERAVLHMAGQFDVGIDQLRSDLLDLVAQLAARDLVEVDASSTPEGST